MSPHVSRVEGYKDSDITHQLDATGLAVGVQMKPLLVEGKLDRLFCFEYAGIAFSELLHCGRLAPGERWLPLCPECIAVQVPQDDKCYIVIKPRCFVPAKLLVARPLLISVIIEEVARGFLQERELALDHRVEIHRTCIGW